MLTGKKYQPEDLLRILRRRWPLIAMPFVLLSVIAVFGSQYLPERFRSETLIMVVPQRVPESYVKATVTTRIEDRLQSISQQILSRTRLERIVQDFNLYPVERQRGIMEDVIDQMRKDINVQIVKGDAFRITYTSDSPQTAMKVTERLATLFIDENLKDREVLANGTNDFLEAQLQEARQKLVSLEQKLEVYRRQYTGQLPSQLQPNLQALQNTQMQIQALVDSANRERDRKLMLERLLGDGDSTPGTASTGGAAEDEQGSGSAAQQLDQARKGLAALELRLKPEHPDIRRLKRTIAELQVRADAEALQAPVSPRGPVIAANPADAARLTRIREMRAEMESVSRQIATKEAEEKRLRALAASYQVKIDAVPTRESELAELTRDYETTQKVYQDLLSKKQDSQVAANLERRQIGEQFKVLDPARLPEKPYSPNRLLIGGGGMAGGLALGLTLVFLLEYQDRSLRSERDVTLMLNLPVVATVPRMRTTEEQRLEARRKLLAWGSAAAGLCLAVLVAGWKFRTVIEQWVR